MTSFFCLTSYFSTCALSSLIFAQMAQTSLRRTTRDFRVKIVSHFNLWCLFWLSFTAHEKAYDCLNIILIFICVHVFMCVYVAHVQEFYVALKLIVRFSLWLGLEVILNYLVVEPGTEFSSSSRAGSAFNCWAASLAPKICNLVLFNLCFKGTLILFAKS